MIYDIIIGPIETVVEWCFLFITDKMPFIGIVGALVGVIVFINFLALPLYNIADSIKEKERSLQLKLQKQQEIRQQLRVGQNWFGVVFVRILRWCTD